MSDEIPDWMRRSVRRHLSGDPKSQWDRAVKEYVAELTKDKERLEWMFAHDAAVMRGGIIERRKGNGPTAYYIAAYYIEWIDSEGGICTQSDRFADYREAIDAAREESPK